MTTGSNSIPDWQLTQPAVEGKGDGMTMYSNPVHEQLPHVEEGKGGSYIPRGQLEEGRGDSMTTGSNPIHMQLCQPESTSRDSLQDITPHDDSTESHQDDHENND